MANRLSPAARSDIAESVAGMLETRAKQRHAHPRLGYYAGAFREIAQRIDAAMGRTGAWRKLRASTSSELARLDELIDYLLVRLHNDLDAETTLRLNEPARARMADEILGALFPAHSLPQLIGLQVDRETSEISKLLATAATPHVARELKVLGVEGYIPRLQVAVGQIAEVLDARDRQARSTSGTEGTASDIAPEFDRLWKRFDGFLDDAFDPDVPEEAAVAEELRTPIREALARHDSVRRAAETREARRRKPASPEPSEEPK